MRADLHTHSIYSEHPSEWFLQRLGTAESYTPIEHIYQTCLKRGMDLVTITDHNRIAGSILLKEKYPHNVITGLEATTYFPEDNCKIHLLIYGLNEKQFRDVQILRQDIYQLREFIKQEELAYSLAHATYSINKKLTIEHLEKLILLFNNFEVVNGGRNKLNNQTWQDVLENLHPDLIYDLYRKYKIEPLGAEPWKKGFTGGSDDHAGLFLGQSYTELTASNSEEFLQALRQGKCRGYGRHNDYQALAFTIYKIALDFAKHKSPEASNSFLSQITGYIFEKKEISWKHRLKIKRMKSEENNLRDLCFELLEHLKNEDNVDNRFAIAYEKMSDISDYFFSKILNSFVFNLQKGDFYKIIRNLSSSLPGIFLAAPFFSTLKHMYQNRLLLEEVAQKYGSQKAQTKKNILWFTDTIDDLNGVSVTMNKIYATSLQKELPICLVSSKEIYSESAYFLPLPVLYKFELPFYESIKMALPSLLKAIKKIHDRHPSQIVISTPGPVGLVAILAARLLNIKAIGIYHTDFTSQADRLKTDASLTDLINSYTIWFYKQVDEIKVPARAYMDILEERGIERSKMSLFSRGIDLEEFSYKNGGKEYLCQAYGVKPGFFFLYTGRVSEDKNIETILAAFKLLNLANASLFITGDGPHRKTLEKKYASENTIFTGRIDHRILPLFYSGADLFLFPSTTDTFGLSVLEAQACGLYVLTTDKGGPKEIIMPETTGRILPDVEPQTWANAMLNAYNSMHENTDVRSLCRENAEKFGNWEDFTENFLLSL